MFLEATLTCDIDGAPYRVYVNDELITERFYANHKPNTVSNDLMVKLADTDSYSVRIENLSENIVTLKKYTLKEKLDEDS